MKIKLVKGSSIRFLVVTNADGSETAGGAQEAYSEFPVYHPEGIIYFDPTRYNYMPEELKGKVFKLVPEAEVEIVEEIDCKPAQEKYEEYRELIGTCNEIVHARYNPDPRLGEKKDEVIP